MPDFEEIPQLVCSFRFADLRHDGNLSLVVGIDSSGRKLCSEVYIVDKTGSGFKIYLAGGSGADVANNIEDIGHDGKFEYILDLDLGTLREQCIAGWPVVYAWTDGAYRNVSDRFKDFYRQILDSLNKRISALPPRQSPYQTSTKECLLAEVAQIQRFLGVSSDAGLEQAVRLANSKDPAEREFAADQFASMDPGVASKYLEMLARDPDRNVSDQAKYYVSGLSKGPIRPPDELERMQ